MDCKIINNAGIDLAELEPHVQGMFDHFHKRIGFSKPPVMVFDSDPGNSSKVLGKTAYYDPQTFEVHVYVDDRHPKDMLRSIAHELIHHQQNLEGRLDVGGYHGEGYYLENEKLRKLEQEAMLEGNKLLREYEDGLKLKKENKMSIKEWKNKELFENLMEKMGIKTNILNEELENPELADLDDDGKLSPYEKKRGAAIEKSIASQSRKSGAETQGDVQKARKKGKKPEGKKVEEAFTSITPDFKKAYVQFKYPKKDLSKMTDKQIDQDYATLVQGKPDGRPTKKELEKMAKKGNKTAEKLAADLSRGQPKQANETSAAAGVAGHVDSIDEGEKGPSDFFDVKTGHQMIYDPDHKDAAKTGRLKGYRRETEEENDEAVAMMIQRDAERAKAASLATAVRDAETAAAAPHVRGMLDPLEEEEHAEPVGAGIEDITADDVLGNQPGSPFPVGSQEAFTQVFTKFRKRDGTLDYAKIMEVYENLDEENQKKFVDFILRNPLIFNNMKQPDVDFALDLNPDAVDAALADLEIEPGLPPKSSLKESVNKLLKENKKLRLRLKK